MDLSIIILTYNNKKILEDCILSIQKFTRVNYEVIVVDNNSSDGTQDLVRSKFPHVKLIANSQNLGFTRANNKGLGSASGHYALILNDDTYLKDDAFSHIIAFMEKHTDIGICGPKLLNIDGTTQYQGSFLSKPRWNSKIPVDVPFVIGAAMFIRTSILNEIGTFDENLFFYNDDLDICKSAKKAGYRVVYYPEASIFHYGGLGSKKKRNWFFFVEGIRSGLYFCRKHYSPFVYQSYRLFIIAASIFMSILASPLYFIEKERFQSYRSIMNIALNEEIILKI
jgi:GT2 family glycosyltransferase